MSFLHIRAEARGLWNEKHSSCSYLKIPISSGAAGSIVSFIYAVSPSTGFIHPSSGKNGMKPVFIN
jgi:hypothetical protein